MRLIANIFCGELAEPVSVGIEGRWRRIAELGFIGRRTTPHHTRVAIMKFTSTPVVFSLLTALALFATSCSRSTKFSAVLDGGFDPVATFRQHGYTVQNEARGEGISNEVHGYGWQSWCGVLGGTQKEARGEAVAVLIRDELNRALNGSSLDELTVRASRSEGHPLTGMLRYNKDGVHGDMHVWLVPDATNSAVSYVIFVREERLK